MTYSTSRPLQLSYMVTPFKDGVTWFLFNWLNKRYVSIDDGRHPLYRMLEQGAATPVSLEGFEEDADWLEEQHFLTREQESIFRIVRTRLGDYFSPDDLVLTLMPVGNDCNFRCSYCYEEHYRTKYMDDVECDIVMRHIEKSRPRSVKLDYFGGEPLLNKRFILRLNRRVLEWCRSSGVPFAGSSMTTNGYCLDENFFRDALQVGITGFQITLDGPPGIHDANRPLKGGKPTYAVIVRNILSMLRVDAPFLITLRVNFAPGVHSMEIYSRFFAELRRQLGADPRLLLMPETIENWSGDFAAAFDSYRSTLDAKLQLEQLAMDNGFTLLSTAIYASDDPHACYSGKEGSSIIYPASRNAAGETECAVKKCTLCLEDKRNDVGRLDARGELQKYPSWRAWSYSPDALPAKCRRCHFLLACHGVACPLKNAIAGDLVCPPEVQHAEVTARRIVDFIIRSAEA